MRVPVRLPIQYAHAGAGVRRASVPAGPRLRGLDAYGGDVRLRNPLSLVFHGGLGQDGAPIEQTYTITAPAQDTSYLFQTGDILPSTLETPSAPSFDTSFLFRPGDILPSLAVVPTAGTVAAAPSSSSLINPNNWWQELAQVLPAITGAAATIGRAVTGAGGAAPMSYVIPATATMPAQRVVYNPTTGQVTTAPVAPAGLVYNPATGQYTTAASALPGFLQAAPGAAWYQNPLVLLGGGLVAVLFVIMAARR